MNLILINKEQLAEMLGIKPGTIQKYVQQRKIPFYRIAHNIIRFNPLEITKWLEAKKVGR